MNIAQYFAENILNESLVLGFIYDLDKRNILLICDYANDALQAVLQRRPPPSVEPLRLNDGTPYHRDFRKLIFGDITKYVRKDVTNWKLANYVDRYLARDHQGGVVIESFRITPEKIVGSFKVDINFGNFGRCSFDFTQLQVDRKVARTMGKDDAGNWIYVDSKTGQQIDFYKPFN